MAGIIGNMTAQARMRRFRKDILSDKCVYKLEPFSASGFNPEIDNKYIETRIRNRTEIKRKVEEERIREEAEEEEKVLSHDQTFQLILLGLALEQATVTKRWP